jgi:hypothetical protein
MSHTCMSLSSKIKSEYLMFLMGTGTLTDDFQFEYGVYSAA